MRLGTRRSALALAQANIVAELLGGCEVVPIVTAGDRGAAASDKSRWVAELEEALLAGRIDIAVHSAKDLPAQLADGLALLGAPARAAAADVLCGARALADLPDGARVGTSSIRRLAQLRAARADLDVVPLRGNVDTRLAKLAAREDGVDAIVLARAGLERLDREAEAGGVLDVARFVPAPGQGAIALEGRADDGAARSAAQAITDADAYSCLLTERALARELDASCDTPLGAHATAAAPAAAPATEAAAAAAAAAAGGVLRLRAWVGLPDGSEWISDELQGARAEPEALARELAGRLRAVGAEELLARATSRAASARR